MSWYLVVAGLVGGVGLFLLGMRLMTEGLEVAAGRALRDLLERGTRTRVRALAAGMSITALVQASAAVTVATIGFVNAGLLPLSRAVWVIYGSNIGTTMTGWLVAITGLRIDIHLFALPLIGIGMLLRLTGAETRRGALGEALAGFGLFFVGLDILQETMGRFAEHASLESLAGMGALGVVLFVGIGVVLTVLMQSSSAALAITLSAATSGLIDLADASAMVIGANLGTTSTSLLSTISATPDARRTAAAHVAFNLIAAVVALALLPFAVEAIRVSLTFAGYEPMPAAVLAAFHTVFNVLGVLAIWPLSDRLVRFLLGRFRTAGEDAGRPLHLDASVLAVPAVAVRAVALETRRAGHLATRIVAASVAAESPDRESMRRDEAAFDALIGAISDYVAKLDRKHLAHEVAETLQRLVRTTQHWVIAVDQAESVADMRRNVPEAEAADAGLTGPFGKAARELCVRADPAAESFDLSSVAQQFGAVQERYEEARRSMLEEATRGTTDVRRVMTRQHLVSDVRRAMRHLLQAAEELSEQARVSRTPEEPPSAA